MNTPRLITIILLVLAMIPFLFLAGCDGGSDGGGGSSSLMGVWEGLMGDDPDDIEGIFEFLAGGDVRAYVMTLLIFGTYDYDVEAATITVAATSYKSFGNDVVIEGSPFDGDEDLEWVDVNISGGTLTVTEIDDDPPDTNTYSFTKSSESFPESVEEIDATEITVNISNAEAIADAYFVVFAMSMEPTLDPCGQAAAQYIPDLSTFDVLEDDGPGGIGFDQLTSTGTGVVKVYLPNDDFTEDTMDFIFMGMDFDPVYGITEEAFMHATYMSYANWDGESNPYENARVTVTRGVPVEVTMDVFVPFG